MNLEHLCKKIYENWTNLNESKKQKIIIFLKKQFINLNKKRNKLKLGFIVFEIKEYRIKDFPYVFFEDIGIKFTRQDTTQEDDLKFENRLNKFNWKWDFANVFSFLLIFYFIFKYFIFFPLFSFFYPILNDPQYNLVSLQLCDLIGSLLFDPNFYFFKLFNLSLTSFFIDFFVLILKKFIFI